MIAIHLMIIHGQKRIHGGVKNVAVTVRPILLRLNYEDSQ
jgi:hypothetical protein